jgi:hypothetical protein
MDFSLHISPWLAAPLIGLLVAYLKRALRLDGRPDPATVSREGNPPAPEALPPPDEPEQGPGGVGRLRRGIQGVGKPVQGRDGWGNRGGS